MAFVGAVAIAVPYLLLLLGVGATVALTYLSQKNPGALVELHHIITTASPNERAQALKTLGQMVQSVYQTEDLQRELGLTPDQARALSWAVDAQVQASLATVPALPAAGTFSSMQALDDWWRQVSTGALPEGFSLKQAAQYYMQEQARLQAAQPQAPAAAPPAVLPTPITVPTAPPAAPPVAAAPPGVLVNVDTASIGRAISDALGGLGGTLSGAIPAAAIAALSAVLSQAENLGDNLHRGSLKSQLTAGQKMMELLTSVGGPLATMALLESPVIRQKITDPITKWVFDNLINFPTRQGHIRPEDAPVIARRLFEEAMGLGLAAHAASVAAEASAPLKSMGVGYLAAFAADMAGFGRLAGATMGVLQTRALAVPIGYYVNSQVRSALPNLGDTQRLLAQRQITPAQFEQLLAYNGISPEYSSGYEHLAYRPPAPRILQQIADAGTYDEGYFRGALEASEYDDATITQVLRMLESRAQGELKTLFTGVAIRRYREGQDDEARLQVHLTTLGVQPQLLPKYLYASRLQRDLDAWLEARARSEEAEKTLGPVMISVALARYREGQDDEARLRTNLTTLGVKEELLPRYLYGAQLDRDHTIWREAQETQKKAAEAARPVMLSAAVALYKEGYSSEAQLIQDLGLLGADPEQIPRQIYAARLQERYDRLSDIRTVLREAVRRGVLDPLGMQEELVAQGVQPGRAELLAQLEELRLVGKKTAG